MSAASLFVLLDAVATSMMVTRYGLDTEANPFMRHVIQTSGFAGMYMVKLAGLALYWASMTWYKDTTGREYDLWPEVLILLVFVPTVVVGFIVALL